MKILFLLILSVSVSTIASAQSGLPETWNQNSAYTSGFLVISNGSTYLAQQVVPSGTALTSTAYWQSLDSAVPTSSPGTAPTSTPDVSSAPTATPDGGGTDTPSDPNPPIAAAKQIGLASRGFCGSLTTDPLIAGFFISGTTPKSVIVTAKGPSLPISEVANPLADPQLYIVSGTTGAVVGGPINNWQDSPDATAISSSGRAPTSSLDAAAILKDLAPGPYSAICYGDNITGTALIEVYEYADGDQEDAKFDGLATRGYCGALSSEPRIVGFFVGGDANTTVDLYVGAKGPSLPPAEVSNPISDPAIYIVSGTTGAVVAGPIDDWQDGTDAATLSSIGRAPTDSKDAALILRDLSPGPYSAIVYGTGDVTGTVLVEVYEVDLE